LITFALDREDVLSGVFKKFFFLLMNKKKRKRHLCLVPSFPISHLPKLQIERGFYSPMTVKQRFNITVKDNDDAGAFSALKAFDGYSKPLDDFRVRTATGASITLVSFCIILLLVLSEFSDYLTVAMRPSLVVDRSRREKMVHD
jgi:hypothetical protein